MYLEFMNFPYLVFLTSLCFVPDLDLLLSRDSLLARLFGGVILGIGELRAMCHSCGRLLRDAAPNIGSLLADCLAEEGF